MNNSENKNIENFYTVSLSYEKADTKIRGKFSFFPEMVNKFSQRIKECVPDTSIFILSTCNRIEIYAQTQNINFVISQFCEIIGVSSSEFTAYTSVYRGKEAIIHFLRVSAGLESQILGDFEIISQIKTWFKRFKKLNVTNSFLERLVNTGIQASKKIKSTTALSTGVTSMSYASVHYILNNFENLSEKRITLVGTGKIGRNTCENLIKHIDKPKVIIINRTLTKAKELSEIFNLDYKDYSELYSQINQSDIVIVATGASQPIIRKEHIISHRPITLIDLSIPENISVDLKELENISLLNVDDLSKIINTTLQQRNEEVPKAENIIFEILEEFIIWIENRKKYVPIIHAFKSDLERIKEYQLRTLQKDLIDLNENETVLSDKLVQKITNRLADYLIKNPEKAEDAMTLFKEMFQLQISNSRA